MHVAPRPVSIDDKYELREGIAFMTGMQALVRVPLEQAWRDREAGLTSGTLISGYPGSPIAALDQLLHRAKSKYFELLNIHFVPAVNEEIAAATVYGAHMGEIYGGRNVDAVTGIWYGQSPGQLGPAGNPGPVVYELRSDSCSSAMKKCMFSRSNSLSSSGLISAWASSVIRTAKQSSSAFLLGNQISITTS